MLFVIGLSSTLSTFSVLALTGRVLFLFFACSSEDMAVSVIWEFTDATFSALLLPEAMSVGVCISFGSSSLVVCAK